MTTNLKLLITSIFSSLLVYCAKGVSPPPAIGDIRLIPYTGDPDLIGFFEPMIYYTDGHSKPGYGGTCADDSYQQEGIVMCRQLGYAFDRFQYRYTNSSVWFKEIQCDDSGSLHILRCRNTVASGAERYSPNVCGPENFKLLIKCDFTQPLAPYNGKVALCQADDATPYSSTSLGLVSIYYNDYSAWRGLNQKGRQPLGAYEADAICRQMGFTGAYPGSVLTRNATDYKFDKCFDARENYKPLFTLQHGAWLTTDDINCQGPQRCLGCCFKYPYRGTCPDCNEIYNVIIRCSFDPLKSQLSDGTGGTPNDCTLNSGKKVAQCESDHSHKEIKNLKIGLGIVTAALIVILGMLSLYVLCHLCRDRLHRRYEAVINQFRRCCVPIRRCLGYRAIRDNNAGDNQNEQPA